MKVHFQITFYLHRNEALHLLIRISQVLESNHCSTSTIMMLSFEHEIGKNFNFISGTPVIPRMHNIDK